MMSNKQIQPVINTKTISKEKVKQGGVVFFISGLYILHFSNINRYLSVKKVEPNR